MKVGTFTHLRILGVVGTFKAGGGKEFVNAGLFQPGCGALEVVEKMNWSATTRAEFKEDKVPV